MSITIRILKKALAEKEKSLEDLNHSMTRNVWIEINPFNDECKKITEDIRKEKNTFRKKNLENTSATAIKKLKKKRRELEMKEKSQTSKRTYKKKEALESEIKTLTEDFLKLVN